MWTCQLKHEKWRHTLSIKPSSSEWNTSFLELHISIFVISLHYLALHFWNVSKINRLIIRAFNDIWCLSREFVTLLISETVSRLYLKFSQSEAIAPGFWPMRGQHSGPVISLDQSEVSVSSSWSFGITSWHSSFSEVRYGHRWLEAFRIFCKYFNQNLLRIITDQEWTL